MQSKSNTAASTNFVINNIYAIAKLSLTKSNASVYCLSRINHHIDVSCSPPCNAMLRTQLLDARSIQTNGISFVTPTMTFLACSGCLRAHRQMSQRERRLRMEQLGGEKGWSHDHNMYGKIPKTKDCLRRRQASEQRIGKRVREGVG